MRYDVVERSWGSLSRSLTKESITGHVDPTKSIGCSHVALCTPAHFSLNLMRSFFFFLSDLSRLKWTNRDSHKKLGGNRI